MKKKVSFWLLLILLFAAFLRLYRLDRLELFGDELDIGYHAYSLLKTGHDYYGQKLPFYIHSFSEWRAPLLMYATVPFVAVFGLNEWGIRLPPVFFSILNIFLLYHLVKILTKNERLSLFSAFLLAVTPWHIHYSRVAFEATFLLTLILGGTVAFLKKKWLSSTLLFTLSFYTYNTANIFVPLWILLLFLVTKQKIGKLFNIYYLIFIILLLPLIFVTIKGEGANRFKLISIFNNPKTIDTIIFKRNTGVSSAKERIFHNKLTGWGKEFISNYLISFSPQYLFLEGDPNPRHNPPGFGEFYWVLAPFLALGIFETLKDKNTLFKKIVFFWLILTPIPSAMTVGGGNQATRLFLMLPPLIVLAAAGIIKFIGHSLFKNFIFYILYFIFLFSWLHNYFVHYPKENFKHWHYGYKEAFSWLKVKENQYQRVIVNNNYEPALLRYLFWTGKNPVEFKRDFSGDQINKEILPKFDGFNLGKVYFGEINDRDKLLWLRENLGNDDLYLAFQMDEVAGDWNWEKSPPEGIKVLKTVYNPWGEPLMYWITKQNQK